jgi:hypothetical protein
MASDVQDLKRKFKAQLASVVDEMFEALETCASDLERREAELLEREVLVEDFQQELEALRSDLEATDNHARYSTPETYAVDGDTFLAASELPERERHILATLQVMSKRDEQGRWSVVVSTKELMRAASTNFDPVTRGAASACLTRLTHKGLIATESLNGQGYPRRIVLKVRLESPQEFTSYTPG